MKLLLVIDVVADNKYIWKAKDEEKLTNWISEHFSGSSEGNHQLNSEDMKTNN